MSPELERLIQLQEIETRAAQARRRITEAPAEIAALDSRLSTAHESVDAAREAVTANQTERRSIEKDLIAVQQRLSKYKEQLMAVKTNDEYHAMQHQIATTTGDVGAEEERMLVNMMAADECAAALKAAEARLKAEEAAVAAERKTIESAAVAAEGVAAECAAARAALVPHIAPGTLASFERVLHGRQGIAIAQAIEERCSVCQVRLRPQVFYEVRKNESVVQCDSCQRILYYVPPNPADVQSV